MKPYKPVATCPKCGFSAEQDTEYHGPLEHAEAVVGGQVVIVEDRPEFLRRTCVRCGFAWKEAVLEQPE